MGRTRRQDPEIQVVSANLWLDFLQQLQADIDDLRSNIITAKYRYLRSQCKVINGLLYSIMKKLVLWAKVFMTEPMGCQQKKIANLALNR